VTIDDLAVAITIALDQYGWPEAVRGVKQFCISFEDADERTRVEMITPEPRDTGQRAFDAMLAGLAEHLAFHNGLKVPRWALDPKRSVEDKWWFATDTPSLRLLCFVDAPASFACRGVFLPRSTLAHI
jgi:hypothetical protein